MAGDSARPPFSGRAETSAAQDSRRTKDRHREGCCSNSKVSEQELKGGHVNLWRFRIEFGWRLLGWRSSCRARSPEEVLTPIEFSPASANQLTGLDRENR